MNEKDRLTPNGGRRNGRNGRETDPACGSGVAKAPGIPMGTTGQGRRGEDRQWN